MGVPQDSTSVIEVNECALNENTEGGNIPPDRAEVHQNRKTYRMRPKVDFTAAICCLDFLLVPYYIFKLFNILCQKIKSMPSVFHANKCDTHLPNKDCSAQARDNQDTISFVENKKPKSVHTKLVQRQSFAHGV